ncbi:hypothetical protein K3495_g6736 [Podosphaera aphanis]|nr:hypothetical protein K3495_g6736 [Podosphaera aphanis]
MAQEKNYNNLNSKTLRYQSLIMSFTKKETLTHANKNEGSSNSNSHFRTDTAISGARNLVERQLQRWVSDAPVEIDGSLEPSRNKPLEAWDQFAENKRLFGITTDYNENIYTTTIDRSHPKYKQRIAEAEKKAREIENSAPSYPHVAEERILNNVGGACDGTDEEEKYSGVNRQQSLPSSSTPSSTKYLPPGRRAISVLPSSTNSPVDPAIILSQLARSNKTLSEKVDASTPAAIHNSIKPDVMIPSTSDSSFKTTTENKAHASPISSKLNTQPRVNNEIVHPNASATVERDVACAFKSFASQQRKNVDQIRLSKAKNDKECKLNDLKAFASSFKLHTPVPSDLVSIIAKDPKKQREIQARARRNVEEAEASKASSAETSKTVPTAEVRLNSRPLPTSSQVPSSSPSSRQNIGRNHQIALRASSQQPSSMQQSRATLGNRMKDLDQNKQGHLSASPTPNQDTRVAPVPTNHTETNRFSKVSSTLGARLNPNSSEFRPSPHAVSFNPSSTSSPRSTVTCPAPMPVTRSVLRRTPVAKEERLQIAGHFDILENIKMMTPPSGKELAWKATGDLKPAYDTQPIWKQATPEDRPDSAIRMSYKMFDSAPFISQTMSPLNPTHIFPQAPHQHQLPAHLQNGASSISARPSPRQSPISLHENPHGMTPTYNGVHDDHRMIASHSAQSFTSPRFHGAPMGYLSPLSHTSHLAYSPQMMQYSNAHQMQPGHRSLSNSQYLPQQTPLGPIMMPNPSGTFHASQNMVHSPQMMFQGNQPPPFVPGTNGQPPPAPSMNGYSSPSRSAHGVSHILQQGHQQPIYGINPGISPCLNYGTPMFSQQPPPVQMPMRPYTGPSNHSCASSPQQFHLYGPQNRRSHQPNSSYTINKNFHHMQPQTIVTNNQIPSTLQNRGPDLSDEAK